MHEDQIDAGIAATAPLVEQNLKDVQQIFETNTFGVLRCVQVISIPIIEYALTPSLILHASEEIETESAPMAT